MVLLAEVGLVVVLCGFGVGGAQLIGDAWLDNPSVAQITGPIDRHW